MHCRRVTSIVLFVALLPCARVAAQDWWNAPRYISENADGYFYGIGDLDGDGDPDLVSTVGQFFYPTAYRVFLNNGVGEFVDLPTVNLPAGVTFTGFFPGLADVTGDGRLDLLLRARSSQPILHAVAVFPGLGGGQFGAMVVTQLAGDAIDIDVGDNDGDAAMEIAVAHRVSNSGTSDVEVRWLDWNGASFTQSSAVLYPHLSPLGGIASVESFDLNGDGLDDIVAGSYYNPTIHRLFTVAGQPQSGPSTPIPLSTSSGVRLTKGDLDGDGDTDLLAAGMTVTVNPSAEWGHFRLLRFSPGGSFVTSTESSFKDFPDLFDINGCRLVDWDGDGKAEMVSNTWGTIVGQAYTTDFGIFTLTGGVKLAASTRIDGQGHVADVGDLNGDGFVDAVSPRAIVFGHGTLDAIGPRPTALVFGSALNTPKISVVDWEGDGDLDILDAQARLAVNDGTGDLGNGFNDALFPWPDPPLNHAYEDAVAIGDFDGDGRDDYLAPFGQLFIFTNIFIEMRLLSDDGAGGYVDVGAAAPAGVRIEDLGAGGLSLTVDVDGDGDLDLLAVDGYWPNQGTGFFGAKVPAYVGTPRAAADVEGDGDVDVLVSRVLTFPSWELTLFEQQPGGSFSPVSLAIAELSTYTGELLDVDGDGDLDALAGGREDGVVHLFRNDGPGAFTALTFPGVAAAADVFALDDVDGDGVTDLISASAFGSDGPYGLPRVQVLRRNGGPGSLQFDPARVWIATGADRIDDVDEDGDLDVIGRRVVQSRRYDGVEAGVVRQYGIGTAGTGGAVPVLGANGPMRPGSTTASIRLRRGVGGSSALLVAGIAEGNLPMGFGTSLLVQPPLFFVVSLPISGTPGVVGDGQLDFDVTGATAAAAGFAFYHQVFVLDPAHPLGAAASNGLELIYGL